MVSHNHTDEPSHESLERRHEQEDLSARSIVTFLAILTGSTLAIAVVMLGLLYWLGVRAVDRDIEPSPLAAAKQIPPEPRLQALPAVDVKQMRQQEQAFLNSYGWVSREAKVVRMPIEQAMKTVVERGLPVWPIAPPATAAEAGNAPVHGTGAPENAPQAPAPAVSPTPASPADAEVSARQANAAPAPAASETPTAAPTDAPAQ